MREILRRHPGREVALVISSGGGLLREAVEMAEIVERFRILVRVPSGATCRIGLLLRACRLADQDGRLGRAGWGS